MIQRLLPAALLATLATSSPVSRARPEDAVSKRQNLVQGLLQDLQLTTAVTIPDSIDAASRSLENLAEASPKPSTIVVLAENLLEAGLTADNAVDLVSVVRGGLTGDNSITNINPRMPSTQIYPSVSSEDAPYDIPEATLRAAIHIPSSFRYGQGAQPIILVPGTGNTGYVTFSGNYIPLLTNSNIADPVWLNIPGGSDQGSSWRHNVLTPSSQHRLSQRRHPGELRVRCLRHQLHLFHLRHECLNRNLVPRRS